VTVTATEAPGRPPPDGLRALAGCGGCAAKADPMLVGLLAAAADARSTSVGHGDRVMLECPNDATVYRLEADRARAATVDFFPPVVEDAHDYGTVAAANAVSDVYAIGDEVTFALVLSGFLHSVAAETVAATTTAAADVVAACGGQVLGGHSVCCSEPVFGLAVLGFVDPSRVWRKSGVLPGDVLMLSKPLGSGVLITEDRPAGVHSAASVMKTSNRAAARSLAECREDPHAITDVTGYGLAGHAWEMAQRSEVTLRLHAERMPLIHGAGAAADSGVRTSADASTRRALEGRVRVAPEVPVQQVLAHDPQTSGGLLAAVRPADVSTLERQGLSVVGSAHAGPAWVELVLGRSPVMSGS
jgi:selenide,water dikinase